MIGLRLVRETLTASVKSDAPHLSLYSYLDASDASDEHSASALCPYLPPYDDAMSVLMKTLLRSGLDHQHSPPQHVFLTCGDVALDPHLDRCYVRCRLNDGGSYGGDESDEESVSVSGLGSGLELLVLLAKYLVR